MAKATCQTPHGAHALQKQDEGEVVYSDETTILLPDEQEEQLLQELKNYEYVTQTRNLSINWGKVNILPANTRKGLKYHPEPFDNIQ